MTAIIGIALWALIPGFIAKKKGRSFWGYYFLSFLITPLVTMIITACLKNISGEADHSDENVIEMTGASETTEISRAFPENNLSAPVLLSSNQPPKDDSIEGPADQTPVLRKIQYCRRCGFKLVDGSEFCSNCGTQIEKESDL
jgi:hypothetical protein